MAKEFGVVVPGSLTAAHKYVSLRSGPYCLEAESTSRRSNSCPRRAQLTHHFAWPGESWPAPKKLARKLEQSAHDFAIFLIRTIALFSIKVPISRGG